MLSAFKKAGKNLQKAGKSVGDGIEKAGKTVGKGVGKVTATPAATKGKSPGKEEVRSDTAAQAQGSEHTTSRGGSFAEGRHTEHDEKAASTSAVLSHGSGSVSLAHPRTVSGGASVQAESAAAAAPHDAAHVAPPPPRGRPRIVTSTPSQASPSPQPPPTPQAPSPDSPGSDVEFAFDTDDGDGGEEEEVMVRIAPSAAPPPAAAPRMPSRAGTPMPHSITPTERRLPQRGVPTSAVKTPSEAALPAAAAVANGGKSPSAQSLPAKSPTVVSPTVPAPKRISTPLPSSGTTDSGSLRFEEGSPMGPAKTEVFMSPRIPPSSGSLDFVTDIENTNTDRVTLSSGRGGGGGNGGGVGVLNSIDFAVMTDDAPTTAVPAAAPVVHMAGLEAPPAAVEPSAPKQQQQQKTVSGGAPSLGRSEDNDSVHASSGDRGSSVSGATAGTAERKDDVRPPPTSSPIEQIPKSVSPTEKGPSERRVTISPRNNGETSEGTPPSKPSPKENRQSSADSAAAASGSGKKEAEKQSENGSAKVASAPKASGGKKAASPRGPGAPLSATVSGKKLPARPAAASPLGKRPVTPTAKAKKRAAAADEVAVELPAPRTSSARKQRLRKPTVDEPDSESDAASERLKAAVVDYRAILKQCQEDLRAYEERRNRKASSRRGSARHSRSVYDNEASTDEDRRDDGPRTSSHPRRHRSTSVEEDGSYASRSASSAHRAPRRGSSGQQLWSTADVGDDASPAEDLSEAERVLRLVQREHYRGQRRQSRGATTASRSPSSVPRRPASAPRAATTGRRGSVPSSARDVSRHARSARGRGEYRVESAPLRTLRTYSAPRRGQPPSSLAVGGRDAPTTTTATTVNGIPVSPLRTRLSRFYNPAFPTSFGQSPYRLSFSPRVPLSPRAPRPADALTSEDAILEEVDRKLDVLVEQIAFHDEVVELEMMTSPWERLYHLNNRRERDERREQLAQYNKLLRIRERILTGEIDREVQAREARRARQEALLTDPDGVYLRLYNRARRRTGSGIANRTTSSARASSRGSEGGGGGGRSSANTSRNDSALKSRSSRGTGNTSSSYLEEPSRHDRLYLQAMAGRRRRDLLAAEVEAERQQKELEEYVVARLAAKVVRRVRSEEGRRLLSPEEATAQARQELKEELKQNPDVNSAYTALLQDRRLTPREQRLMSNRLWKQGYVPKKTLERKKEARELQECTFHPEVNEYPPVLISREREEEEKREHGEGTHTSASAPAESSGRRKDRCEVLYNQAKVRQRKEEELRTDRDREMRLRILKSRLANDHHFRRRVELDPSLAERFMSSLVV